MEERFDIAKAAGGPSRSVVREFAGIAVRDAIQDRAKALPGMPSPTVLCGVEVIAQKVLVAQKNAK